MAQFVVRNIDSTVKERLRRRAQRNGRSLEEEVRDILRQATRREEQVPSRGLGTQIAARFAKTGLDFTIPELRGHALPPPDFDE